MKKLFCLMGLILLLFHTSCAHRTADPQQSTKNPTSLRNLSLQLGNRILCSIKQDDPSDLALLLKQHGSPGFDQAQFQAARKEFLQQLGQIRSFTFLAELKTPLVCNMLWIVELERESKEHKQKIRQELLFRLVTVKSGGSLRIMGSGFF